VSKTGVQLKVEEYSVRELAREEIPGLTRGIPRSINGRPVTTPCPIACGPVGHMGSRPGGSGDSSQSHCMD
jgi:hypothetical protein